MNFAEQYLNLIGFRLLFLGQKENEMFFNFAYVLEEGGSFA